MEKSIKRMATMHRLQTAGLDLFYANGFYNTSIDEILKKLNLSKGAFYYHFSSKEEFFSQIIQNLITKKIYSNLIEPIEGHDNPLTLISDCFEQALETAVNNDIDFGCLISNFITEFQGKNEIIMQQLNEIVSVWEVNLITALQKGKYNGYIDRHVDCEAVAIYLMSSYFGIRTLMVGSNPNSKKYRFMRQLKQYIKTLEPKSILA